MPIKPRGPVIAIEEHYWDAELASHFTGLEAGRPGETQRRLDDLGALRLKEMDEAGIDIQVLSHGAPSAQKIGADIAVDLIRRVNDRLHQAIAAHPRGLRALRRCLPPRPRPRPTNWSVALPGSVSRAL